MKDWKSIPSTIKNQNTLFRSNRNGCFIALFALAAIVVSPSLTAAPAANEIIQRCDLETPLGKDQRSEMTVILRDPEGNEKKRVYHRYWIDNKGKRDVLDKMVLFTEFPLDAKGTAFMRWNYMPNLHKNAEQWLYLPSLKTIRRVSVRDPGDSFLGSEMTYYDIDIHLPEDNRNRLLREETRDGKKYYVIETIPGGDNPLYSKEIAWYLTADDWSDCNKTRIEYYDGHGALQKVQKMSWQKVDGAWVWDQAIVDNQQSGHTSIFRIRDVEINVGLKQRLFTERTMKRGIR